MVPEEDEKLVNHITTYGHGSWSSVPKLAGLQRCGKSCRLRWINYLRPDLKRGSFSEQEEQIIIDVHRILGNRWAQIAKHLPGRTDNEVKNFWNSCIKKKLISQGLDPKTHNLIPSHQRANNNKVAAENILQSHQPPFSIITLNLQMTDASMEMNPPILTLPAAPSSNSIHQPPSMQTSSVPIFTSGDHHNPNIPWTVNDHQNSLDSTIFPYVSSFQNTAISSSSSSVNPSGFGLLDENCFWGHNTIAENFEAPRMEVLQAQEQENNQATEEVDAAKGVQDMDASFDGSSFGLEFVESTLLSSSMCRELDSMDDLAWNF
ncbi:hypothetical protein GH714_010302 [Hevea brasiliensis]|uniref:Uncharacterized protein n=1 Tax=Hevea brasiliensis TaxID=3981 RepID=A0A6A6LTF7_HEVBR|nr:hypothetical protein GH714_010302 [Hevea brasiliensis]